MIETSLALPRNTILYYCNAVIRRTPVVPPLEFEGGLG